MAQNHGHDIRPTTLAPAGSPAAALQVLVLDRQTREYLKRYDPKALQQACKALQAAGLSYLVSDAPIDVCWYCFEVLQASGACRSCTQAGRQLPADVWTVKTAAQLEAEGAPIAQLAAAAGTPAEEPVTGPDACERREAGDWRHYSASARGTNARRCTCCGIRESLTPDWTLWPWGDQALLCTTCNDARLDVEEYR